MRLLVDCTYVYENPHINSGIQRVVRNIISRLGSTNQIAEAIPVILRDNDIYEVMQLTASNRGLPVANRLLSKLTRERIKYWLLYERTAQIRRLTVRRMLFLLFKAGDLLFHVFIRLLSRLVRRSEIGTRISALKIEPGDVLVLLDASWYSDSRAYLEELKEHGTTIVCVIYDLIPLTHPHFCNDSVVIVFQRWFHWVLQNSDGFMTISKTVRDQLKEYIRDWISEQKMQSLWFDYFYLSSDLDLAKDRIVRPKLKELFQYAPVYLMVGTLEPRKNHAYLLDAFELLWKKNIRVRLLFAGHVGWKCQALMNRIKNHEEFNKNLFMFNDLNDAELECCYRNSKSLVFPALVEGFGLPLVEALQRGLPAMAGDIPIFHEIGGDFIAYFDLGNPETLEQLVRQYEQSGKFPASRPIHEWSWLNWEQSTKRFVSKITSNLVSPVR